MKVQLSDGRSVSFPEGTSNEVALSYIQKNFPEAPNPVERLGGLLSKGAGAFVDKVANLTTYTPFANEATMQGFQNMQELFTENPLARAVTAHPLTSIPGQVAEGITEFLPQLPLYAGGEAVGMNLLRRVAPTVAGKLAPVVGENILKDTARAVGRATVAGATVGTAAGLPADASLLEKVTEGGKEAASFAGATAVLHPSFRLLSAAGRAIYRRMGKNATPEKVELELEKKAETDPAAAEDLQRLKEAKAKEAAPEELYVPKDVEEATTPPTKEQQGVLNLEEIAGPEQMAKFKELGYEEADLRGQPDSVLETILAQNIKKVPKSPIATEVLKTEEWQGDLDIWKTPDAKQEAGAGAITPDRSVSLERLDDGRIKRTIRNKETGEIISEEFLYRNDKTGNNDWAPVDKLINASLVLSKNKGDALSELGLKEEVKSDTKNEEGLQGRKRRRKEPIEGQPEQGGGGAQVSASGDVQAHEGEVSQAKEGVKPFGKKITKDPDDILDLQRLGYSGKEIAKMSAEEARSTLEAVKNVPPPSAEEVAKAEAIAAKVRETALAREEAKRVAAQAEVTATETRKAEEKKAKALAEVEKDIADVEAETDAEVKEGKVSTILDKLIDVEDPTLDVLVDNAPKSREEVVSLFMQRAKAAAEAKKKAAQAKPIDPEEFNRIRAEARKRKAENEKGVARRTRKTPEELEAEANALLGDEFKEDTGEPLGVDEVMKDDINRERVARGESPEEGALGEITFTKEPGGFTLGSGLGGLQEGYEKLIKVWHGTKERFERVRNDKIGSGEGNQSYGWGHYFSSAKSIGEHYAKTIGGKEVKYNGTSLTEILRTIPKNKLAENALYNIRYADSTLSKEMTYLKDEIERLTHEASLFDPIKHQSAIDWNTTTRRVHQEAYDIIKDIKVEKGTKVLHEFNLPADLNLLDLDKAVSKEQKVAIQNALKEDIPSMSTSRAEQAQRYIEEIKDYKPSLITDGDLESASESVNNYLYDLYTSTGGNYTPSNVSSMSYTEKLSFIRDFMSDNQGDETILEAVLGPLYTKLTGITGHSVQTKLQSLYGTTNASKFLRDKAGIHGNTYIGGSSGERNYVIFDEADVPPVTSTVTLDSLGLQQIYEKLTGRRKIDKYGIYELKQKAIKNQHIVDEFKRTIEEITSRGPDYIKEKGHIIKDQTERMQSYQEKVDKYSSLADELQKTLDGTTTLDSLGLQQIYDWTKKLVSSNKIQQAAPSNKIVAEINGQKLTMRGDSEHVDGVMKNIALNIERLARSKVMSPDFAYRNNPKIEPLTFALHKRIYEANFAASKRNEVVRSAEAMLPDLASKEKIKDLLEGKVVEGATDAQKEAARMLKEELSAVREKYKGFLRDEYKRNLNEDENAALAEILSGQPIEQVIAKYKEHIVPDKLGRRRTRRWLDEEVVRDIAKEYQEIDSWGLDDYMSHHERGTMKIMSGGKLYAKAVSEKDAARKFADLVQLYPDKDFQLDTDVNIEALATGLSKRSYNRLLFHLQEGIKKNIEGINSQAAFRLAQKGLKGRFFITPTHQFSPYTMDRKDFLQGEKNVFDVLYNYMYSMEKKMALDPAIDSIRAAITKQEVVGTEKYKSKDGSIKEREIKRPYLKKEESDFLQQLVTDVKGRYYTMDKIVDSLLSGTGYQRGYSKAIQGARELEANLKLGYAPVKGMINGASGVGHIWTKTGTEYVVKGTEFLRTAEGKEFMKAMEPYLGVNIVESATGELSSRGTFEKLGILSAPKTEAGRLAHAAIEPLGAFQAPEIPVRRLTIAANYLMAKDSGLSEVAARDAAIKANWFQQFTYDMASLPEIMRGPTGRLLTQFKPYLLKEMEFISTLRGPELARYIGMQIALAGPRGLVMILKSLPVLGAFGGLEELEEWMNKEYPRLSRGIGGAVGVDVSAAATFQFPSTMRDWLGPVLSDIGAFYKNVTQPVLEGKGFDGTDMMKFMGSTLPVIRYYRNIIEQVVDKDGWVKDERGRRVYHIDNMPGFVTKNVMGAEPLELSRIRTEERILSQRSSKISDQKVDTIDDILDVISKGQPLDAEVVDKMVRLGVTPSTLRRAARFRVLDPRQRRLLMTEIIRRPEILERYPEASDLE